MTRKWFRIAALISAGTLLGSLSSCDANTAFDSILMARFAALRERLLPGRRSVYR
jgi:hypothetical protein